MIESKGYKITPIDGDLAVSRNAEIGRDMDIQGKARVAGSLKVEGFLDAPNIKGVVKGLFATEEELKREYPNPRPGWCAIVLADKESGFLYLAKNREWEKQSEEAKPFDFIVDSINVFASKGELAEETQRAQSAENKLQLNIETEAATRMAAVDEIKGKAALFGTFASRADAEGVSIKYENINHYEGAFSIPVATEEKAGIVSAEDKKKFVKSITWNNNNNPSNMNNFVVAGVYDIKGEHTRMDDNLPILNTGGGHSFNARLTVLDSSISGSGENDDKCITQVLSFSNRLGQGEVYIRTGKGSSLDNLTWDNWSTLQRNVNVDTVTSLDHLVDNGIYSGVLKKGPMVTDYETFVMVVINDYAVTGEEKRVSQFKYGLNAYGEPSYESRYSYIPEGYTFPTWTEWEILNQKEISSMIKSSVDNAIKGIIADAPEAFDTLKEIADWIANDETGAVALANAISANTKAINTEVTRAEQAEQTINNKLNTEIERSVAADQDLLRGIDDEARRATEAEEAIVEATDKKIAAEIDKIKDGDIIVGQAREIHSRNGKTITDSFLIRTTAGSGTIGDGVASLKSVGGNIVKNLVPLINSNGWKAHGTSGNLTFNNGIAFWGGGNAYTGIRTIGTYKTLSGHKYYLMVYIYADSDYLLFVNIGGSSVGNGTVSNKWRVLSLIFDKELNGDVRFLPNVASKSYYITKPLLIDLTEMFGAGNEPTKEECDRLFGTMDALPQGLSIANPTEFKSTGFNQFNPDNVLEDKGITNNAIVDGAKKIAVIPCLPCKVGTGENNGYCIHGDFGEDINVYLTPLNPMEVDGELYMHELTKDATTDTYVPLIKGYMLVEVPTTANLCAHFLWSEDKCERDTYEPYHESKVELPTIPQMSEWGLAGIQSNGTLVCDEIDFERGVYVKRIGIIDLGLPDWKLGNNGLFYFGKSGILYKDNILCSRYTTLIDGISDIKQDKVIAFHNDVCRLVDLSYNTTNELKSSLQGVMLYYELATPEEYPLPKVDNNYISSDYGVEQFDSVVPCNANNLYYMRSLAGETRNFLDRMYDNTDKTDAKEVADYITEGIEGNKELATNAPNLALRALFVAAGAEYNDTDQIIQKTAPWDDSVEHLPKHYYLNGLGDITEEEMTAIYARGRFNESDASPLGYSTFSANAIRTNLLRAGRWNATLNSQLFAPDNKVIESINLHTSKQASEIFVNMDSTNLLFYGCKKLAYFNRYAPLSATNWNANAFSGCISLKEIFIKDLKSNITFSDSMEISKRSVLFLINRAAPTSAITITLHADAYARIANQPDIIEALEAQPLVTLVSA